MEIVNHENAPTYTGLSRLFFENPVDGDLWTIELVKLTGKWYASIVVVRGGTAQCRFCLTLAQYRQLVGASQDITNRLTDMNNSESEEEQTGQVHYHFELCSAATYKIMVELSIDQADDYIDLTVFTRKHLTDEYKRTRHSIRLDGGSWMMLLQQTEEFEKCVKFLEGFGDKLDGMPF